MLDHMLPPTFAVVVACGFGKNGYRVKAKRPFLFVRLSLALTNFCRIWFLPAWLYFCWFRLIWRIIFYIFFCRFLKPIGQAMSLRQIHKAHRNILFERIFESLPFRREDCEWIIDSQFR